jgi:hypothetical protein
MKKLYRILVYTLGFFSVHSFGQQTLTASNASNEGGAIQLLNPLKTANNTANNWTFYNMTGPYGNSLQFWNYGNGGFYGSRFTILDNGNVGIGITTPPEKLVVQGNSAKIKIQTDSDPINYNTYIESNYNAANTFNIVDQGIKKFGSKELGVGTNDTYVNSYYGIGFSTNTTSVESSKVRMYISQLGNVGIGTTNPTSKLTVAGNISSREVKVTVDAGADFVFENDYDLPSLITVEKYIKENKHLPEIASAEEMKKDGINLSEMNVKLLQKIEELTLYTIEQEKRNDIQSQKIEALEKENQSFKSLSERLSKLENQSK